MMTAEQSELWRRIQAYSMDDPTSSHPFTTKLAREQGWSATFARRAIEEYKRFVFLCVASGHTACPSEVVDEVWHLHLTYSNSYWNEFCPKVLGQALHHFPSKGGPGELSKHIELYNQTLASYRRLFQAEPPRDIWPPAKERFAAPQPKSPVGVMKLVGAMGFLVMLALLAPDYMGMVLNPFDLRGPEYLVFYAAAVATGLAIAGFLRWKLREPSDEPQTDPQLDAYETACLARSPVLAINAAIAGLVQREVLGLTAGTRRLVRKTPLREGAHPLEQAVYNAVPEEEPVAAKDVRAALLEQAKLANHRLEELGLLHQGWAGARIRVLPLLVALIAPVLGVVKIAVGMMRDRPVAYLVVGVIASVVVALVLFARSGSRTRRGDKVLELMRKKHRELEHGWSKGTPEHAAVELPLAMGLFGMGLLAAPGLTDLQRGLRPEQGESAGWGYGGGGCGGGGCGGGGCGGGGCGGGGCGGCGGGD